MQSAYMLSNSLCTNDLKANEAGKHARMLHSYASASMMEKKISTTMLLLVLFKQRYKE